MKRLAFFLFVCFGMIANNMFAQQTTTSSVTDSTGLPGDNFSLQGALEMFKQSKTPEDFEKKLNTENNYVNNLDLNGDGKTDYVRVIDKSKGNVHAIVLQVAVNKTESQDVAVIEIEKQDKESAILQIVGDPELYGDSTIVEPVEAKGEKTKGAGPSGQLSSVSMFFVNVWFWPCVTYIYQPVYVVYESPWYWDYYPYWWSPWRPMSWYWHHHYCYNYYYYGYRPVYTYRIPHAHDYYYGNRRTSPTVSSRYQDAHQQYQYNRTNQAQKANFNNTLGKPVNSNQGKLNNLESKPVNGNQGKANNYNNQPVNANQGKVNTYDNKPGNTYNGKPATMNQGKDNHYQSKPANNYQSKPGTMNQGKQDNNNQSKPANTYQSKPNNQVQGKPGSTNQTKPVNSYKGNPSNGQKTQPAGSSRSGNHSGTTFQKSNSGKSGQGMKQNSGSHSGKGRTK